MATFREVAPIFTVRDVGAALAHYASLGFTVAPYEDGLEYAFVERVDDADALHAEWRDAGVDGRLGAPEDTPWGLREGVHIDPEGNLIRFGSFLDGR